MPEVPLSTRDLLGRLLLWAALFSTAALLANAETAITTLWPWKVKRLAEEEARLAAVAKAAEAEAAEAKAAEEARLVAEAEAKAAEAKAAEEARLVAK